MNIKLNIDFACHSENDKHLRFDQLSLWMFGASKRADVPISVWTLSVVSQAALPLPSSLLLSTIYLRTSTILTRRKSTGLRPGRFNQTQPRRILKRRDTKRNRDSRNRAEEVSPLSTVLQRHWTPLSCSFVAACFFCSWSFLPSEQVSAPLTKCPPSLRKPLSLSRCRECR